RVLVLRVLVLILVLAALDPCTTLCRSRSSRIASPHHEHAGSRDQDQQHLENDTSRVAGERPGDLGPDRPERATRQAPHGRHECEDRKSTRLNSSHVKSSYAVFCLNKKN